MTETTSRRARTIARRVTVTIAPPLRRVLDDRSARLTANRLLEKQVAGQQRQITELKAHIARLESVPRPTAADGGPRTQLGYLIIVSYGRSGSTLLQGMLNATPGYLIRGENRAALYRLHQFHASLEAARDQFGRTDSLTSRDSWFGIDEYASGFAMSQMRALVLDALLKPQPETRIIGFKEIRWWQKDWQNYLAFLRELLPGVRFVLNTRNHDAVARSRWWRNRPRAKVLATLERYEKQLTTMAEMLGADAYRVHYEDYAKDPDALIDLFKWLGEPFDRAAIERVMRVRHSF